jgi:anti-anti-sigma regulatory factor
VRNDAPEVVESNKVTILVLIGSLFFATTTAFKKQLPKMEENTRNAVVIINLRHKTDLVSIFLWEFERFSEDHRDHESKLMLAGISRMAKSVFEDTSRMKVYGRENILWALKLGMNNDH